MARHPDRIIHIAAALIDDGQGRLLLVRKAGSSWFMQAGGKIEPGESALSALARELREEIGLSLNDGEARYLGQFCAAAANEAGHIVVADLFHVRRSFSPAVGAEIAEAVWVAPEAAEHLALAPLTRAHVLALSQTLEEWRS